jgi:hypothetical protein
MADVPRTARVTEAGQQRNLALSQSLGLAAGGSKIPQQARSVRRPGDAPFGIAGVPPIVLVFHDDVTTIARPDALIVYWIGAGLPEHILDFDLWYNANVDH